MKNKEWFFIFGAVCVLSGTVLHIAHLWVAPYVFALGALFVFFLRLVFPVSKSSDFRVKRLIKIQLISSVLLLVSSYFMFVGETTWALSLFLAAFLDLFIAFRLPKEQK
jgi:hypothetical protein